MTFNDKCYQLLAQIPQGKVSTYKEIAKALNTKAYRAVGNAMAKNPNPIIVSCHRVINSNGLIGGYGLGVDKKISLLQKEGVTIRKRRVVGYEKIIHSFV